MPSQPVGTIRMLATGTFKDAVFSPDGTTLYASHGGTITAYNVASGAVIGNWTLGTTLGGIDISTDGHTLVATEQQVGPTTGNSTDIYVYKLDTTNGTVTTFTGHGGGGFAQYWDASMLSNGQALLTQHYWGSGWLPLTTLDLTTGTFTTSSQSYSQDGVLVGSADRSHILFGPENISDAPMFIYTTGSGVTASHQGYADNVQGYNYGVQAISPDGNLVAQGVGLNIYDGSLHYLTSLTKLYPQLGYNVTGMAFSPKGDTLYLLDSSSKFVTELETTNWNVIGQFSVETDIGPSGGSYGNVLQVSKDGHYLSVIATAGIEMIDLTKVVPQGGTNGNDTITGTTYNDVLSGFGGDDSINGGAGIDTMYGGTGNDIYVVDNISDQIIEYDQQGTDTIFSSVSYTLPQFVEKLILTGDAVAGYGNSIGGTILGTDRANVLTAGYSFFTSGGMTLLGAGGDDTITGGSGDDSIRGGLGNDMIISGAGNDTLTGGDGADTFGGTLADLSGDTITDLRAGDRIAISGVDYATFTYERGENFLKFGTSPVWIGATPVRFVVTQDKSIAGVDLVVAEPVRGLTDFNGDGHSDILWRNANGAVSTWQASGTPVGSQLQGGVFNGYADPSWKIVETGDFNGDLVSDILWRNQNGEVAIWHGNGNGGFASDYGHPIVGTQWKIAAVGDLNGDGKDDLLWRHDGGAVSAWYSTGSGFAEAAYNHAPVGTSWKIDGLADFNGDGRADILWRNDDGNLSIWTNTANGFAEASYANSSVGRDWHIAGLADFNGDGKDDILWRHDNGSISIWRSNGNGFDQAVYNNSSVGNDWHIVMVGDFNNDGKADLLWKNDGGAVSTWESTGSGFNVAVANGFVGSGWNVIGHEFVL